MSRKQSITGGGVLLFSLLFMCAGVTTFAGQRRRQPQKPAATTVRPKLKPAVLKQREPEIQLERLPPDPSVESADIAITANVRARSLVFEAVPNPSVTFPGSHSRDTVWEAQRENLPTPVEPGVTYRNIGIRLKITSVFRDIDRIVAEALGEIPVTDDPKTVASTDKSSVKQPDPSSSKAGRSRSPKRER